MYFWRQTRRYSDSRHAKKLSGRFKAAQVPVPLIPQELASFPDPTGAALIQTGTEVNAVSGWRREPSGPKLEFWTRRLRGGGLVFCAIALAGSSFLETLGGTCVRTLRHVSALVAGTRTHVHPGIRAAHPLVSYPNLTFSVCSLELVNTGLVKHTK